jgi:hypothetical protein
VNFFETIKSRISETLGITRPVHYRNRGIPNYRYTPTFDYGSVDHVFWDRARYGKIEGLEISGAFLKPLSSKITSYVLGRQPTIEFENAYTQEFIDNWLKQHYATIQEADNESRILGDMYIVLNADLTMTAISPDVVFPIIDESDYSKIVGWGVEQVYVHPNDPTLKMYITELFYPTTRIRYKSSEPIDVYAQPPPGGSVLDRQVFNNYLDDLPILHLAANRKPNELFGHPDAEALLPLLNEYNEVLLAGLTGNKRQGRPTPTIEGLGDAATVQQFQATYGTQRTETDADGTVHTYWDYAFDADQLMILGGTGKFEYKSPALFAQDTEKFLGLLFYILVQNAEIPEFAFGTAIEGSKASAEVQVDPFVRYIERQQKIVEKWFRKLILMVLQYAKLYDRRIKIETDFKISWKPVTNTEGMLILAAANAALQAGAVDRLTFLKALPLNIENPTQAVADAEAETVYMTKLMQSLQPTTTDGNTDSVNDNTGDEGATPRTNERSTNPARSTESARDSIGSTQWTQRFRSQI